MYSDFIFKESLTEPFEKAYVHLLNLPISKMFFLGLSEPTFASSGVGTLTEFAFFEILVEVKKLRAFKKSFVDFMQVFFKQRDRMLWEASLN